MELTDEYDALVEEYDVQVRILTRDLDLLHSEGQVVSSAPKKTKLIAVDGNEIELTDGLPLQGHILIVGETGSGKSMLVTTQIMRRIRGGQLVHCIDTKGEIEPNFGHYVDCVTPDGAVAKFDELLDIATIRRELFRATVKSKGVPCANHGDYFRITGEKLPIIALIVEELIVLMGTVPEKKLIEMLVICRSAGIFVVCLAQYMKADILSRQGMINFGTRVFLGQYDNVSCNLIFTLNKQTKSMVEEFVGEPGKAAIQEAGKISTRAMPLVEDSHLIPFIQELV